MKTTKSFCLQCSRSLDTIQFTVHATTDTNLQENLFRNRIGDKSYSSQIHSSLPFLQLLKLVVRNHNDFPKKEIIPPNSNKDWLESIPFSSCSIWNRISLVKVSSSVMYQDSLHIRIWALKYRYLPINQLISVDAWSSHRCWCDFEPWFCSSFTRWEVGFLEGFNSSH